MNRNYTNVDKALEIMHTLKIEAAPKYAGRAILNRDLQQKLISKWKRRGSITFCGQYTSEFFLKAGYDMEPFLCGKSYLNVNTTGQYANAQKNKVREVTAEQAHYLPLIGRPVLVLSPNSMEVAGKRWNHAAVTYPKFWEKYNDKKGPAISQQGWSSLCPGHVLDSAAWGKAWAWIQKNNAQELWIVKYFLPDLR